MANRQYFTLKFDSSFLREMKFNVDLSFEDALLTNKIVALADNEILRLIRKETNREIDLEEIENWYSERDKLKNQKNSIENRERIRELQRLIWDAMYIPEYITIVMETKADYSRLFKKGVVVNGKKYVRGSCSASQGRVSTVVFLEEQVCERVLERLDNGRDKSKKLVPSKYNAYLGTAGSATKVVSQPRVCIVPDCFKTKKVRVNWVTETESEWLDDEIEERDVDIDFNLFDGNGLISPSMAQRWAEELGLDYLPAQWCIRASFTKGMLSVFDFVEFCSEINNKNYNVKTLYGEIVDLREVDVILTESQFKLWDSYVSYQDYEDKCRVNGLNWGISLQTPKQDKNVLEMNYQFLQTLKLSNEDVKELCRTTVEHFEGISSENIYYTLMFLMGKDLTEENIINRMISSDNYWLLALMLNHELINDSYIREKVYEKITARIKDSCMGRILVEGNFQVIVPDSFALMEHVCGLEVKGLLNEDEFYSQYWSNKNVLKVDAMRSPLTHISEHNIINIVQNEKLNKWFKYYYTGLIANCKDEHTLKFSGSDYDYDIIATTSNEIVINGVHKDQHPIVYEPPKAEKKEITAQNLYLADTFTFGSIIGAITNKTTNMYALLPLFKPESLEYSILMNRLKMGCKLQSAQIDKAKIGKKVKGIPKLWHTYLKGEEEVLLEVEESKEVLNSILCDKHPYFFIYLYRDTYKKYKNYYDGYEKLCRIQFGMKIEDLKKLSRKDKDQREFLDNFNKYLPVIDSDCEMNRICHYMESINFNIKKKLKISRKNDLSYLFLDENYEKNEENFEKILKIVSDLRKDLTINAKTLSLKAKGTGISNSNEMKDNLIRRARYHLNAVTSDKRELTNCLVEIFYKHRPSYNKGILFQLCGKYIVEKMKEDCEFKVKIPVKDEKGDIIYLNERYCVKEVEI
jgi:hypothetical protein